MEREQYEAILNSYRDELERVALNYARATLAGCYLETYSDRPPEIVHLNRERAAEFAEMFANNMKRTAQDMLRHVASTGEH